ncbi:MULTISPECIES: hypothetical protein [unclassified Modestobacter]|uniref:hypothetical protein n=1 Tax=unclassified Modestobacter TaxID=2643866 RepID=UPI0022AA4797|nr:MULTISPECIES: hypothetical protein [unclassified Modestobacter]MCZ2824286.1 hypothetical protein [Modestobacter sp. VKM Ac-2981]MCZ2854186.1 hypothetical protein [Modestobacter sp. VKM Ac-2982]
MSTPTRTQRRAERLDDPRFERFRTLRARRLLVAALCGLLAVEGVLFLFIEASPVAVLIPLSLVIVAFVFCLGALKASTRGIEELPADALDERQWQLRGEAYARAYRIGFGLLVLELAAVVAWRVAEWGTPGTGVLTAALLLPFHVGLVLPTMVTAWSSRA